MRRLACLFVITLVGTQGLAADELPTWSSLGVVLSADSGPWLAGNRGTWTFAGGKYSGQAAVTVEVDAATVTTRLAIEGADYQARFTFDHRGRVEKGRVRYGFPGAADTFGFDDRTLVGTPFQTAVVFQKQGRESGRSAVDRDPDTLDTDALPIVLRGLLRQGPRDFRSDVAVTSRGLKVSMAFKYFPPGSPLPETLNAQLPNRPARRHVFEMGPTGLWALVSSARYYMVFLDAPGLPFEGYWGGSGSEAESLVLEP